MKKFTLLLLSLILLLCSCKSEATANCRLTAARICASLDDGEDFQSADDDFISATFDFTDTTKENVLFLDTNDGGMREIGIFMVENISDAKAVEQKIRAYLEGEAEAITSLLALYPTDDLSERLWRYQNATLLSKGHYIAYFVLSHEESKTAKAMFLSAVSA